MIICETAFRVTRNAVDELSIPAFLGRQCAGFSDTSFDAAPFECGADYIDEILGITSAFSVSHMPSNAAIFVVPSLKMDGRQINGCAFRRDPIIFVRVLRPASFLSTLHHELWHHYEHQKILSESELELVSSAAKRGISYSDSYCDSLIERRARLYAAWASAMNEGYQILSIGERFQPIDALFYEVHSGARLRAYEAAEAAARQPMPEPLLSRARRALGVLISRPAVASG